MLSNRAKSITPSLTLGISTKVKAMKKAGEKIVNLSIGEPDFFTPEVAKNGGIEAIKANQTKYDAASGLLDLKQAIADKLKNENNIDYAPEQIVISSGAKYSLTNTMLSILNPDDEVLIPVPYWLSYPEIVKLTGAVPVFVETKAENNFKLSLDELKAAITPKTKAIIINNPSNPTGAVYTKAELTELCTELANNNIYIIADEIYERITYTDFTSVAEISENVKKHCIIVNGMSKSLSMTGWRVGYTACETEIAKAMGAIQGHLVSHPSTISQYAALAGLKNAQSDIEMMRKTYQKRRDFVTGELDKVDGISYIKPDGAFYVFISMAALRDKLAFEDSLSVTIAEQLLADYKIAVVPGVAFGKDDYIRISYAASDDDLKIGLAAIATYFKKNYEQ